MPDWLTPELRNQILDGVVVTLWVTTLTTFASLAVGTIAALGRRSLSRLRRRTAATFVEIFRNVPALIWVIFFAFAIPNLVPVDDRKAVFFDNGFVDLVGDLTGLSLPYYALAAALALTLNSGAHIAEVLRGAMNAVPVPQVEAARTLGASDLKVNRTVIVPWAYRLGFPAVSNRLIHNMKNTALVSFVAVPDLFGAIQGAITKTFRASELLVIAALAYLVLTALMGLALRLVESRLWRGQSARRHVGV